MSRFIPLPSEPPNELKDWEFLNTGIADAFLFEMRRVQRHAKESRISRHDTVYTGIAGIAFMNYHIAKMNIPLKSDILDEENLVAVADRYLADVLYRIPINLEHMYSPTRLSFVETFIGIATLVLVRSPKTTEQVILDNWRPAKEYLGTALHLTLATDDNTDGGCEVLYGRAGMLYALLYLRNAVKDFAEEEKTPLVNLTSDTTIIQLVDSIMARGQHGGHLFSMEFRSSDVAMLPPLMWVWHGKCYLGAAHGVAGILQLLLSCPFPIIRAHISNILKTVQWLVHLQDHSGNWPSSSSSHRGRRDNDIVQWCHGAPGMIILLSKMLRVIHLHEDELEVDKAITAKLFQSLDLGAQLVYKRGLLRKGVGLCHGIGGNIYALLAASNILDSGTSDSASTLSDLARNRRNFFAKAAHLAHLAKFYKDPSVLPGMRTPDHPWSLYEGMAGMCCAWAEILCRMNSRSPRRGKSSFPAYDDL